MPTRYLLTSLFVLLWLISLPSLAVSQADEPSSSPVIEKQPPTSTETAKKFTPEMFSGIYSTEYYHSSIDPPWLLSVHIRGNEVLVTDISGHLGFLEVIGYVSDEEASNGLAVSAYDRAFRGQLSPPFEIARNGFGSRLEPILPLAARASNHSETFYLFLDIDFYVRFNTSSGEPFYGMTLTRDAGVVFFSFPVGGYVKIF